MYVNKNCTVMTLAVAGSVGGVMGLIIFIQSVVIILLRQNTKNRAERFSGGLQVQQGEYILHSLH